MVDSIPFLSGLCAFALALPSDQCGHPMVDFQSLFNSQLHDTVPRVSGSTSPPQLPQETGCNFERIFVTTLVTLFRTVPLSSSTGLRAPS